MFLMWLWLQNPNPADDPVISNLLFEKGQDKMVIKMDVSSPKNILGPQNLAFNSKTGEAFAMTPPTPVEDLSDDFPNGVYTLSYSDRNTNPADWYFVVADHSCSNGPIQRYPVNQNILQAQAGGEEPIKTETPTGTPSEIGSKLVVEQGCANCHYFDRESLFEEKSDRINWRVGPGLKGVLEKDKLPASGKPATEENVRTQIREGGNGMPPYPNLSEEEVSNIIAYLETL
jgi:mono/diheme cytochrome c family protein